MSARADEVARRTAEMRAKRLRRRALWMRRNGLSEPRPSTERVTQSMRFWRHLGAVGIDGGVSPQGFDLPSDHAAFFARDRREVVLTAQPYLESWSREEDEAWERVAQFYGLTLTRSTRDSWHLPGATVLLALWLPGEASGDGGRR